MNDYYKIKNICKIKGGKRIPKGEVLQKEKNSHPYIRILDMYQGRIINISKDMLYAKESYIKQIKNYIVNENDVILAIVGNTLGMVSIIGNTLDTAQLTENCCKFVDIQEDKINRLFLYYALISPLNQNVIKKFRVGSSQPKLPLYNVGELLVPKFTLAIQSKISNLLSNIDSKIELNNKINNELEAMAKTIYDYWFLQFEFPNEEGKPYKSSGGKMVWNEELKREIPEGWDVQTLENLGNLIMGQSPKSTSYNNKKEGLPLINGAAELQKDKIEITKYTSEPTRICKKEDLIFCIRATIGNINYADKSYCLGRGVGAFRVTEKEYVEYMFLTLRNILNMYNKILTGSIIVGITKEDLLQQNIIKPKNDVITQFYNKVHFMAEKMKSIKKENQELTSLRDFLLPLLMNGQVGFKGDKAEG